MSDELVTGDSHTTQTNVCIAREAATGTRLVPSTISKPVK